MILRALFPREVRRELDALATELRVDHPDLDAREPFHVVAVVLVWLVREVVKMREVRT
jgi:hypothetical protein